MGGREGWTDGGVGPQRRVIHHTTMQSALVQPLFFLPCRSFFSSSASSSLHKIFFFPYFTSSINLFSFPNPSLTVRLQNKFSPSTHLLSATQQAVSSSRHLSLSISLVFSLALIFRFHHLLWQHSSFLLSIFSPLAFTVSLFFYPFSLSLQKKANVFFTLFP